MNRTGNAVPRTSIAHASRFGILGTLWFRVVVFGTDARQGAVAASPQIDKDIVEIAHDIAVGAEGRHYLLIGRVDVLASLHHDTRELLVIHMLEGIDECGRIARACSIGAVADRAFG